MFYECGHARVVLRHCHPAAAAAATMLISVTCGVPFVFLPINEIAIS